MAFIEIGMSWWTSSKRLKRRVHIEGMEHLQQAHERGHGVILLTALAVFAAAGHVLAVLPLAAFAGILFAWSFLSVASPALTGQLKPDAEGDAQGLLNAGSGLAGLLGSVTAGLAASLWGYPAALAIGASATAAGLTILAATLLRGSNRKAPPNPPAARS